MPNSIITKKAFADGIKELMKKKSFEKISVSDITQACGLTRQTFYYHFQDKYELVNWIYYNEVITVVTKDRTFENWSDGFYDMLSIMKNEQHFYENALKISGQNSFQDYLFLVSRELLLELIGMITIGKEIDEADRAFIAEFFSFGIVGVISNWAKEGMKETPKALTEHLKHLVEDSKQFAVLRYIKEKQAD